jgi:hypothetical protein
MSRKQGFSRPLREAIARIKTALLSAGASVHPHPVFVLGNQKSGTTAIAALVARMVDLPVSLDLKREIADPVIDAVKQNRMSFEKFIDRNRLDFSRDIIKEPSLTLCYDELAERFPKSRFVMVIRDPRENLRSILQRLGLPGSATSLTDDQLNELPRAWRLVVDGRWLGLSGDHYIDMLAERWNYTTDLYLRHEARSILVRFEDFLGDKAGTIRELARNLGLTERRDVSDQVDKPFQPPGDRTVTWADFFGDNLQRIERICGDRMRRFGYEPSI